MTDFNCLAEVNSKGEVIEYLPDRGDLDDYFYIPGVAAEFVAMRIRKAKQSEAIPSKQATLKFASESILVAPSVGGGGVSLARCA